MTDDLTPAASLSRLYSRRSSRGKFFITRIKKGEVVKYGPLWAGKNEDTLKRAATVLIGYFSVISDSAPTLWALGAAEGGGLSMNDGVTVCVNLLSSIFEYLEEVKRIELHDLDAAEIVRLITPFANIVGAHFTALNAEQMALFRSMRGVQGQTASTRKLQLTIKSSHPAFNPAGLDEYTQRQKAQTTTKAFEEIRAIEQILQHTVLSELKNEFGEDEASWWFEGVPKAVRKKVDDRVNEEAGKKGGREQNFDLIDYREIIMQSWETFKEALGRGKSKDGGTKWIIEVNELRKSVMHASKGQSIPIAEEELAALAEIRTWLESQVGNKHESLKERKELATA